MAFVQDGFLALFLGAMKQIWCTIRVSCWKSSAEEGELELLMYPNTSVSDEVDLPIQEFQFNIKLCKRLVRKIAKTRKHIEDHGPFTNNQVLQELDLVMKRAECLLHKCMCKKPKHSWLYAAVALVDMKEDVMEIELDLAWWTSLLSISSPVLDTADWKEDNVVTMALEQLKTLYNKLSAEGSSLRTAALTDKRNLQAMLARMYNKGAVSAKGKEVYFLAMYLLSRLNQYNTVDSVDEDSTFVDQHFRALRRTESGLGSGAYGKVVEVIWLQRVKCALKIIKAERGSSIPDQLKKEGNILKYCCHPNIVQYIWSWEQENKDNENVSHILMERMHTDLSTLIEKQTKDEVGPPFELPVAIDIMLQIAKAMRYIHSKKITHRDLKPGNVLVQLPETGKLPRGAYVLVKLADFGVSKSYSGTETFSSQTAKQGTSLYAAPEVFLPPALDPPKLPRRAKFPPRADVWSFAVTCSEILTGRCPFTGIQRGNLHHRIMEEGIRPALPHDLPIYLRFCITSCWNKFPDHRPNFQNVCRMLCLAKAMSLGILPIDFSTRSLLRSNNPMWQSALHPTAHRTGHEVGETYILIGTSFKCYKNKSMEEELVEERRRGYYQTGIQAVQDEYRFLKPIEKTIMQGCCWAKRMQGIAYGCLTGIFVSSKFESELRKLYVKTVEGGFIGETDHESKTQEIDKHMWGEKNLDKTRRGIRHVGCFYSLGESGEKRYAYLYFKYGLSHPALISHLWHEDSLQLGDRNTADLASADKKVLGSKIFTCREREQHLTFYLAVSPEAGVKSDTEEAS
ncbi:hypothetical protein M758_1G187100 [Ceratodon purpureus]|nr:hypothetical protein M758_1G187100 [Ceratodon purpureus]